MGEYLTTTQIVRAARATLEPYAWDYIAGGAETETTMRRNRAAIDAWAFVARVLCDVRRIDTSSEILGTRLRIPYILAPVGSLQSIHPDGAAAQVRGACTFGTLPVISSVSEPELEEAAAAAPGDKWFQLYVRGDIGWVAEYTKRARDAGYRAFVITADVAHYSNRERQQTHSWVPHGRRAPGDQSYQAALSWKTIDEIRAVAGMPVIVKGIQCGADAAKALEHGIDAVWVSNHGGRQLDHARGTLDMLPEVLQAVGKRIPVIIDGGFMRGTDVVKAIALGADCVAGGKLHAWAIGAGGAPALERMLDLLRDEIETTLALLGVTSLRELDASCVAKADPQAAGGNAFPLLDVADELQP